MRIKLIALTLAVLASTGLGSTASDAERLQVKADEICTQLPALADAYTYTLANYPPTPENVPVIGKELVLRIVYFGAVISASDGPYCNMMRLNDGSGWVSQPDLVNNTLSWNFGNASVALREYQAAVGAH